MKDVNYEDWIDYIEKLFKYYRKNPKKILDLACGTGEATLILKKRGYTVVGLDNSKEMIEVAKKKVGSEEIEFVIQDMRNFELDDKFDAVISLFDSLNNLEKDEDLYKTFRSVRKHIKNDGIFIFDMNTIYCLKYYWGNKTRVKEEEGILSIWRTNFLPKKDTSILHITIFVEEGEYFKRIDEIHRERGYELGLIENTLKRAGFKRVDFYEHLSMLPPKANTLRVMVVAT